MEMTEIRSDGDGSNTQRLSPIYSVNASLESSSSMSGEDQVIGNENENESGKGQEEHEFNEQRNKSQVVEGLSEGGKEQEVPDAEEGTTPTPQCHVNPCSAAASVPPAPIPLPVSEPPQALPQPSPIQGYGYTDYSFQDQSCFVVPTCLIAYNAKAAAMNANANANANTSVPGEDVANHANIDFERLDWRHNTKNNSPSRNGSIHSISNNSNGRLSHKSSRSRLGSKSKSHDPHDDNASINDIGNIESASTWPSITKATEAVMPTYNHISTLFAALVLSTTLAFFSALDAALICTQGNRSVWSFSSSNSIAEYFGFGAQNNEEDVSDDYYYYGQNKTYYHTRWRGLEEEAVDNYYEDEDDGYENDDEMNDQAAENNYGYDQNANNGDDGGNENENENDEMNVYYDYNDKNGQNAAGYYNGNDNYYNNGMSYYGQNQSSSSLSKAEGCRELFSSSILIACPIVVLLAAFAFRRTIRDDGQWKKNAEQLSSVSVPDTISLEQDHNSNRQNVDRDTKRLVEFRNHVENQCKHLKSCYQLFSIALVCAACWIYAQVLIANQSDYPMVDDGQAQELFNLQFQSLGAMDHMGDVGQNANLYYSSWISLLVSIALVYELGRITLKHHETTRNLKVEMMRITRHKDTLTNGVEMIMTWSKAQQTLIKEKKFAWHETLYKLRFRTGLWLTTFIASLVLYFSSNRVWRNSIYPTAVAYGDVIVEDDVVDYDFSSSVCSIIHGYVSLKSRDDMGLIHPSKCEVTKAARATGIICICFALLALLAHCIMHRMVAREMKSYTKMLRAGDNMDQIEEKKRQLIPLRAECLFACIISVVFAINALFATAVDGPASKIGNVYYSSWVGFVMSMRLALSCLEDILEDDDDEEDSIEWQSASYRTPVKRPRVMRWLSVNANFSNREEVSTRLVMLSPTQETEYVKDDEFTIGSYIGGMPIPKENSFHEMFEERVVAEEESSRAKRMRRWASGAIFSSMYLLAALDAAFHKSNGSLDIVQLYMVICPCVFSSFCLLMFFMCLQSSTYHIVDQIKVGGVTSVLLLCMWVGNLILTLHHNSSWAVNEIGEVQMANIYYFTWATVLNAGLLMSSYVKKLFNSKPKALMVVLWLAVVKICFVMFGSCVDILLSVKDQCSAATHGDSTAIFCERTQWGAGLGFIGMAAGFLAAVFRFFNPNPGVHGQTAEAVMSFILTVLFAMGLFLVTGIGGPGQSVGDLYYGSWMAFLASVFTTTNLYSEIKKSAGRSGELALVCAGSSDDETTGGIATPYSYMENRMPSYSIDDHEKRII